jgi:hypothetical protein
MLEMIGIGASEAATVVVERHAILRAPRLESEGVSERIEPEIAASEFLRLELWALNRTYQTSVATASQHMHAVVWPPLETI